MVEFNLVLQQQRNGSLQDRKPWLWIRIYFLRIQIRLDPDLQYYVEPDKKAGLDLTLIDW